MEPLRVFMLFIYAAITTVCAVGSWTAAANGANWHYFSVVGFCAGMAFFGTITSEKK